MNIDFYVDRTAQLRFIEEAGKQLLFLRPRRFGKSLVLSLLENYYDVAKADEFERLFGHLAIGANPTPKHNQYFVLKWDFSNVSAIGEVGDIQRSLKTPHGKVVLRIPNLAIRKLYVEVMREQLLPRTTDRQEAQRVAEWFCQTGEFQPFCDFVEQHQLTLFDNRDAKTANELVIKAVLGTLLFDDTFYITDSETALQRRYADFTMIVRPDCRQYQLFDILLEFKHFKLSEVKSPHGEKLTGAELKILTLAELKALPMVQEALAQATHQLNSYRQVLQQNYGKLLRLRVYAVVAVGFERLVWEEV